MKHLVCTSLCFLIPAIKGFLKGRKTMPVLNMCTAVASANFWRHPEDGVRYKADIIIARTNFLIHQYFLIRYFSVPNLILDVAVAGAFLKSREGGNHWDKWHVLFHLLSVTSTTRLLHHHTPRTYQPARHAPSPA